MMLEKVGLAVLLAFSCAQANAARISFTGGTGDYRVNGFLDYDSNKVGTPSINYLEYPDYYFDGASMSVSLNNGPYRTGPTNLVSFWDRYANGRTISASVALDERRDQLFSLAIFFNRDIVMDGKIIENLPAPTYGELAYLNQLGPGGNTRVDVTFNSVIPELTTWAYLSIGLFLSVAMIRRRKSHAALTLPTQRMLAVTPGRLGSS